MKRFLAIVMILAVLVPIGPLRAEDQGLTLEPVEPELLMEKRPLELREEVTPPPKKAGGFKWYYALGGLALLGLAGGGGGGGGGGGDTSDTGSVSVSW